MSSTNSTTAGQTPTTGASTAANDPATLSNLDVALAYVRAGHRVVLLHERMPDGVCSCRNRDGTCPAKNGKDATGKHPRKARWLRNLITDEAGVHRAWGRYPTANIGICPHPNEILLDVDPRNGGDKTIQKLVDQCGELAGPCASTGGGGNHFVIRLPDGTDIHKVKAKIAKQLKAAGPGIDLRTCNHQVVVEPSIHASGRRYAWLPGRSILDCQPEVPNAAWLRALGITEQPSAPKSRRPARRTTTSHDHDLDRARWGLLEQRFLDPDQGYAAWFRIGATLKCFGDAGLDLWVEASRPSKDFNEQEIRAKWPTISGSSVGALFGMFGDVDPEWRERYRDDRFPHKTAGANTEPQGPSPTTASITTSPNEAAPSEADPSEADPSEDGLIDLGDRDPSTGRIVLSHKKTLPTARAFLREHYREHGAATLLTLGDSLLRWTGNRYVEIEEGAIANQLYPWLHHALRYVYDKSSDSQILVDFESNPATVKAAVATICAQTFLPATTAVPGWLQQPEHGYDPRDLLPCKSSTLHLPSGTTLAPTPLLLNYNALEFDYLGSAAPPTRWLAFMRDMFGDDTESIDLLQEWCGYCLTSDTRLQKMLLMIGPRRSGKGTFGRVLTSLVGATNVVGPTVSSLASNFGLQPLIGKSLAIVSDARFTGPNIGIVVERLLCISGEDSVTIDRKYKDQITTQLPVRFAFLTNELPRFNDASTALAGRFLILNLKQSFYGKEDPGLLQALLAELPGILLWAVEGWHRLRRRSRFAEPASSKAAVQDIEDLSSPVSAFVRECCSVGPSLRVPCGSLFDRWSSWCEAQGMVPTSKAVFGRDLAAGFTTIQRRRDSTNTGFYEGIGFTKENRHG